MDALLPRFTYPLPACTPYVLEVHDFYTLLLYVQGRAARHPVTGRKSDLPQTTCVLAHALLYSVNHDSEPAQCIVAHAFLPPIRLRFHQTASTKAHAGLPRLRRRLNENRPGGHLLSGLTPASSSWNASSPKNPGSGTAPRRAGARRQPSRRRRPPRPRTRS